MNRINIMINCTNTFIISFNHQSFPSTLREREKQRVIRRKKDRDRRNKAREGRERESKRKSDSLVPSPVSDRLFLPVSVHSTDLLCC